LTSTDEINQITQKLVTTYKLQVSRDVIASAFTSQPKLPMLLSRASFRPNASVGTEERNQRRNQVQKSRRNFLRILGLAAVSIPLLLWLQSTYSYQAQAQTDLTNTVAVQTPTGTANPVPPSSTPSRGNLLASAASIPVGRSLILNNPSFGPIILLHLDNGQFVAYSSICTHAGCQVQFDPSAKELICPCHGAVYDPYNNAQVLGGPAPYPLQKIPIQYDQTSGNIYLTG